MHKPLVRSGNSLALVIDKPFRRMMALGPSRIVNVVTDGRRLIIEAVPESKVHETESSHSTFVVPPSVLIDAPKVARQLVGLHQMTEAHLRSLYPRWRSIARYLAHADNAEHAQPEDQRAIHRVHICHEQLVAGRPWNEAIAIADYVVPPSPPSAGDPRIDSIASSGSSSGMRPSSADSGTRCR